VFPGHASMTDLDEIACRFRPKAYILHRRPIDVFISNMKALKVGAWTQANTTEIKPRLAKQKFTEFWGRTRRHYLFAGKILRRHGLPVEASSYEDIYASAQSPVEAVADLLNIDIPESGDGDLKLNKQDKSDTPAEKVANWDEFAAELEAAGLTAMLDDYALDRFSMMDWLRFQIETRLPQELLAQVKEGLTQIRHAQRRRPSNA